MFRREGGESMDRWKLVKEGFPALVFLGIVEAIGGIFLTGAGMHRVPGLLAAVPALISLRGNVSGSFASRLGSLAHLGMFDPKHPFKSSKEGIKAAIILSLSFSAFAALMACGFSLLAGIIPDYLGVIAIALLTAAFSSVVLSSTAVLSVAFAFRHRIDPDNVVVPLLSTVGDLLSIVIMSFFVWLWVVIA
jgi:mgtE-like transporter